MPLNEEKFKKWINDVKWQYERVLKSGPNMYNEPEHLFAVIKMGLLRDIIKVYEQCSCEHKDTHMQMDVGYDIDEEGEEDQHLEKCNHCGAERFHCDHTKYGKTTGEWFISI